MKAKKFIWRMIKLLNTANNRYVFIDTETGGTDPDKHSLLSIGVCIWDIEYGILDYKEFYVENDEYVITKHAQKMNKFNIYEHEIKAMSQIDVINSLLTFCENYFSKNVAFPLIGHNIQFDVNFLKKLFKNNNRSFNQYFSHRYIDTYSVFKTCVLAGLIDKNIDSSAEAFSYFDIKVEKRHSALGDCIATVKLYEKLISLLSNGCI